MTKLRGIGKIKYGNSIIFIKMLKKISSIYNYILPHALIVAGFLIVALSPISFYSNNNLSSAKDASAYLQALEDQENRVIGGDVLINFPGSNPIIPLPIDKSQYEGSITAGSALIVESRSRQPLFQKNHDEVRPLASITKLMSAIVLMELQIDWSSTTTIEQSDGNSDQHILDGEVYVLDDLWNIALVGSSNRAINALVRAIGLKTDGFAMLMNKKASELGLKSMSFEEPTGLSKKNIGNATDVEELLRHALRFEKIYQSLLIKEYYANPLNKDKLRRIWSTDWLMTKWIPNDYIHGSIVGKTGYIPESGYNFVASFTDNSKSHQIIVSILGAETNEKRFEEARDLADWTFEHYVWPDDSRYSELVE
ncbi:MAG: serine hydrolase [bacterium]